MGAVALRPIHKVRLKNLTELVAKRFEGNASEAARAIERSHTFMWQLMNGYRSIGEETARNIERALKLGENALDHKLERTKALVAQLGDGTTQQFHMVPMLTLDDLDAKPSAFRPCPDAAAGPKTFCAEVSAEEMAELHPGDILFADPGQQELVTRKLYVVCEKGRAARVMQAKKLSAQRFVFSATAAATKNERPVDAANVKVIGRVLLVIRTLR